MPFLGWSPTDQGLQMQVGKRKRTQKGDDVESLKEWWKKVRGRKEKDRSHESYKKKSEEGSHKMEWGEERNDKEKKKDQVAGK